MYNYKCFYNQTIYIFNEFITNQTEYRTVYVYSVTNDTVVTREFRT